MEGKIFFELLSILFFNEMKPKRKFFPKKFLYKILQFGEKTIKKSLSIK